MPRNMSFMLTTQQIRDRTKTVTRRRGWQNVKVGEILNACVQCQGLKRGEKVEVICQIRVLVVRRERLDALVKDLEYGKSEVVREGFACGPYGFVALFSSRMKCQFSALVTRIEFEYVD